MNMIKPHDFVKELIKNRLEPFIEVPCSILRPLINYLIDKNLPLETPANEAIAMGLAAGYYMATGKPPVVMMQNSGLCNALNALTSLHGIYKIPALLIVTWRGEPGTNDAPEHQIIGAKLDLFKIFDLPYRIVTIKGYRNEIKEMARKAWEDKKPTILLLRSKTIQNYNIVNDNLNQPLNLYEAIKIIKNLMGGKAVYISTTGFISRASFNAKDYSDFYMLGSMGHALPIGLSIAIKKPNKKVVILDGDGSCLMHIGAMASLSVKKPKNLIHIVLDNQAYSSTGNQPSLSPNIDFLKIAEGFGYRNIATVNTKDELKDTLKSELNRNGPSFIHVKISRKLKEKMKRVSNVYTCPAIKERFMENLKSD